MYYIKTTEKEFNQTCNDLDKAVKNNGFGVLTTHNLGETLRSKGIEFKEQCKIFEVCNPRQANKVISSDMKLNMALPCRISVYSEKGSIKIGFLKPKQMLAALSEDEELQKVAEEVEKIITKIVEETV
jgi:uncharacterized protein (DUF302 family)